MGKNNATSGTRLSYFYWTGFELTFADYTFVPDFSALTNSAALYTTRS